MTTNTAPRPTAREQIATIAAENGWTRTDLSTTAFWMRRRTDRYERGAWQVTVQFTNAGAITDAERLQDRVQCGWFGPRMSGKREAVLAWLREAVERSDETSRDEAGAEALLAAERARVEADAQDVESGQARASVEQLRELATRYDHHVDAGAARHAGIVLARLDDLESRLAEMRDRQAGLIHRTEAARLVAERDNARSLAERRAYDLEDVRASLARAMDRAAELEAQQRDDLATIERQARQLDRQARARDDALESYDAIRNGLAVALNFDPDLPIPTTDQLLRDVVDLRADLVRAESRYERDVRDLQEQRRQAAAQAEFHLAAAADPQVALTEAQAHLQRVGATSSAAMIALADQHAAERDDQPSGRLARMLRRAGVELCPSGHDGRWLVREDVHDLDRGQLGTLRYGLLFVAADGVESFRTGPHDRARTVHDASLATYCTRVWGQYQLHGHSPDVETLDRIADECNADIDAERDREESGLD